ncbi:hypothetical protein FB45DRAFT_931164 [Roridomyces roridus]|uniref:Uncharacterized protein n=1 Tax=Roridomyces roridus TaxID=1738132 RepID=A0AAD7FH15_9AGAR|nr:hypothetical protein FB45DRAFT_931164 [Roridomyces roridus]
MTASSAFSTAPHNSRFANSGPLGENRSLLNDEFRKTVARWRLKLYSPGVIPFSFWGLTKDNHPGHCREYVTMPPQLVRLHFFLRTIESEAVKTAKPTHRIPFCQNCQNFADRLVNQYPGLTIVDKAAKASQKRVYRSAFTKRVLAMEKEAEPVEVIRMILLIQSVRIAQQNSQDAAATSQAAEAASQIADADANRAEALSGSNPRNKQLQRVAKERRWTANFACQDAEHFEQAIGKTRTAAEEAWDRLNREAQEADQALEKARQDLQDYQGSLPALPRAAVVVKSEVAKLANEGVSSIRSEFNIPIPPQ